MFVSKAFLKGYVNLVYSTTGLWLENYCISSPVRYSYLLILPDDNADIFADSQLTLYSSFLSLILLSIVVIGFYILSKEWCSSVKENMILQCIFCKDL